MWEQSQKEGHQPISRPNFLPKNRIAMKEIEPVGGGVCVSKILLCKSATEIHKHWAPLTTSSVTTSTHQDH